MRHLGSHGRIWYRCCYKGVYFYGRTKEEAQKKLDEYKKHQQDGIDPRQISVYNYAKKWLPNTKIGIRDSTYNGYAKMIDVLNSVIGKMALPDVKPSHIKAVYSKCYIGYSDSHIRHAKNLYTSMFDSAMDDGYIRVNPCRAKTARPHKGTIGTHRAITAEERYYIETTDHRVRPIAMLMLYAGLRDGEAIPIDIDRDIDFTEKVIHLRYFRHVEHNQAVIEGSGKNYYAVRDVKLFPQLEEILSGRHGLAIAMRNGNVLSECGWRRAWQSYVNAIECRMNGCQKRWYGHRQKDHERKAIFDRLMAEGKVDEAQQYKLPPWQSFSVKPYDLRHSFCAMCRDLGMFVEYAVKMAWITCQIYLDSKISITRKMKSRSN